MDKARAYKWSSELVGKPIGGWIVDELLGQGKSAIVVKAQRGDQIGALKLFEPELVERFGSEAQLERIEREKSLIGKKLPNLVTVLDGGEHDSLLFVVMEYLPSPWKPLCDCLADVPRAAIWPLISKIADAAKALEEIGLVHRDIKPENIMVLPDFSDARLLDLGVMRPIAGSNITDESSRPFIGTLRYSSPEYLLREEQNTIEGWRAITFYQLGGVLHDLIVRRPLFADYSEPYARLVKAVQEQIPGVEAEDVHITLVQLCNNCLIKSPTVRSKCVSWLDFSVPLQNAESAAEAARERVRKRNLIANQGGGKAPEEQKQREIKREQDNLVDSLRIAIRQVVASDFPPITFNKAHIFGPDQTQFSISFGPSLRHSLSGQVKVDCTLTVVDAAAHVCEIAFSAAEKSGAEPVAVQLLMGVYEQEPVRVKVRDYLFLLIDKYQEG
jgi:serine/threonine protein kinase